MTGLEFDRRARTWFVVINNQVVAAHHVQETAHLTLIEACDGAGLPVPMPSLRAAVLSLRAAAHADAARNGLEAPKGWARIFAGVSTLAATITPAPGWWICGRDGLIELWRVDGSQLRLVARRQVRE